MTPWSRRKLLSTSLLATGLVPGLSACGRTRPTVGADVAEVWSPRPVPLRPDFARGVNLAHQHRRGSGYGSASAARQLDALATLGVRDLALNPFAYTPSVGSTDIRWGGDPTLTDDDLRRQVEQASARGMRVLMKPHLWSPSFWSGAGNPDIAVDRDGWARWFEAYTRYAVHHARIAQETGCAGMCVGLEYTRATMENPGAWAAVAAACRAVFSGTLCYAANWYQEYAVFTDWDAFDCVGIDAYFPLEGTTVDALVASWNTHLDAIHAVTGGKPVVFPEAGYRARVGATAEPWATVEGAADPELQARAYEALLRACAARPWFRGVYWWKWFSDEGPDADAFVPAGPAQAVLRAWFA